MTTNTTTTTTTTPDTYHPQFPIDDLTAHPDNVRHDLGDLTELTRSIKDQGVLVPLLVLPVNDNGARYVIAGHRRLAAANAAGITTVPVIERDLTAREVLDAMLNENAHRNNLTLAEEIAAVARYQSLAPSDSPTKIGKRIGRTPRWVKDRFAAALVPTELRTGDHALTLHAIVAISSLAEHGDDVMLACGQYLSRGWVNDWNHEVAHWWKMHQAEQKLAELREKTIQAGVTFHDDRWAARKYGAVELGEHGLNLNPTEIKNHRREPCHAIAADLDRYNAKLRKVEFCMDPARHAPDTDADTSVRTTAETATPTPTLNRNSRDDEKRNRAARKQRLEYAATAIQGKLRATSRPVAAYLLIAAADRATIKQAAKLFDPDVSQKDGYHEPDRVLIEALNAGKTDAVLMALAVGNIETRQASGAPLHSTTAGGNDTLAHYQGWLASYANHPDEQP